MVRFSLSSLVCFLLTWFSVTLYLSVLTYAFTYPPDFKTHQLPLARIKKIMKSDEDVKVGILLPLLYLELEIVPWIVLLEILLVDVANGPSVLNFDLFHFY